MRSLLAMWLDGNETKMGSPGLALWLCYGSRSLEETVENTTFPGFRPLVTKKIYALPRFLCHLCKQHGFRQLSIKQKHNLTWKVFRPNCPEAHQYIGKAKLPRPGSVCDGLWRCCHWCHPLLYWKITCFNIGMPSLGKVQSSNHCYCDHMTYKIKWVFGSWSGYYVFFFFF